MQYQFLVTTGYNGGVDSAVGHVAFNDSMTDDILKDSVIAPAFTLIDGEWKVTGLALVHRANLDTRTFKEITRRSGDES